MALSEAHGTAREAASAVSVVQRAPHRGRNRARAGGHLDDAAIESRL
jgi:hypothetical protein